MSLISDGELRRLLQTYGVDVGPINDTTRNLYQRKLKTLTRAAGNPSAPSGTKRKRAATNTPKQGSAAKRPRVYDSSQSNNVQAKKSPSLYPDLSELIPPTSSNLSPTQKAPGVSRHVPFSPQHERPIPPISDSEAIPSARQLPSSSRREISDPDSPVIHRGVPKWFPPTTRTHASRYLNPDYQMENLPASHFPERVRASDTSDSPSSEASSSSLSPVGSISPPTPPLKNSSGSSPAARFLGTVTKFIGEKVNQFLNVAEPRRGLQSSAPANQSRDMRRSHPSPNRVHLTPPPPVEEELDSDDEPLETTSHSSAEASPEDRHYDWELHPSDVVLCKRPDGSPFSLGKGGFGEVFKALKDGADEVAVKIIGLSNCTPAVIGEFKAEIDLISKLRHRHIVQFYGACIQPHNLYMVTELMSNDLFSVLRLPREAERYKWSGIYGRNVLIGVASGLNYLHSRSPPVVHRDIKSPNILVMDGVAKIADVGVARTMGNTSPDMTAQRGFSIAWAAPEVVYRRRATEKIDIWSLAVIMWEVVSGKLPRPGTLVLPATCSQQLKVLYCQCISDNPTGRPSALEVVNRLRNMRE